MGFLRDDGILTPAVVAFGMALGAAGVFFEALLYRAFVDLPTMLGISTQRLGALAMLIGFVAGLLLLDVLNARGLLAIGRKLEARVRAHLFHATPRLTDRYFGSRLISDMAERSHAIHEIRGAPMLGAQFVRSIAALSMTLLGIAWLDPQSAVAGIVCALVALGLPLAAEPFLSERDLRFRTHSGALCRFYLDALRGLTPARAHVAEDAIQCEHEDLLVRWAKSGLDRQHVAVTLASMGALANAGLISWVIFGHILRHGGSGAMLLLIYWALNIPVLCGQIALLTWQYPKQKNLARRLLDPLRGAGDAEETHPTTVKQEKADGVSIAFEDVSVRAIGQTILDGCTLEIQGGSHVCIVGASGAGKSTFVSLLLGWHSPSTGRILVDGEPLDQVALEALRSRTAWVDPGVQLWNRSLLDNLYYGASPAETAMSPARVVEQADLLPVLQTLPDGMQTLLGEGGALVSGGEGQRVRLGRAMLRNVPRLVILDEPFTHLDRRGRETLLQRARELWRGATLICITHDVGEAIGFDRVLVFDRGRVVEDGIPSKLASLKGTHFARLLRAEAVLRKRIWARRWWRRLSLANGQVLESSRAETYDEPITGDLLAGSAFGRSAGGALSKSEARFEAGTFDAPAGVAAGRRSRVG
jgi:ATP-binding cassette subfamily B protein